MRCATGITGIRFWRACQPHFDRTTVLSFRCRPVNGIVSDHEELVDAIAARDRERAAETARRHMLRYTENIDTIRQAFPEYFA